MMLPLVPHLTMVRPKSELCQKGSYVLGRDVGVRRADSVPEVLPEILDIVCAVNLPGPLLVQRPLLRAVLHGNVGVPLFAQ